MLRTFLLLLFGVYCCSTAVIWIRLSQTSPVWLAGLRCLIAALALFPIFLRDMRRHALPPRELMRVILPGVILSIHFISWIVGARITLASNASLIVNMSPLFMPVVLYLILREGIRRPEIIGTLLSIAGLVVLAADDFHFDRELFTGDILCFVSMLFFTLYLVLARRNRAFPTIWCYVTPLYLVSGVVSCLAALVIPAESGEFTAWEPLWVVALALVPTVLGHSTLNLAMQRLRGQVVAVANVTQFLFAGIMAFFIFNEVPRATFAIAAALVVAGLGSVYLFQRRNDARG